MGYLRNWWTKFIARLAESNQKEFGGKGPDCCNPDQTPKKS